MSFGERVRAARRMAGLSQEELAARMGVTKQSISKYEKDIMRPQSSTTLISAAQALQVPVDYFFRETLPEPLRVRYRKRASMPVKSLLGITERVSDSLERYLELEELLGIKSEFSAPARHTGLRTADAALFSARELRKDWGVGETIPVPSVSQLLEDRGIRLVAVSGFKDFDGLSGFCGDEPFIAIDERRPKDRLRFTMLHELAHILFWADGHRDDKDDERHCQLFASEFLLPAAALRSELAERARRVISPPELLQIKEKYGISMQAILYRSHLLGLLSDAGYDAALRDFGTRGWRKNEPGEFPGTERPLRFERLLFRAIAEDAISLSKAASLSMLSLDDLRHRLSGADAARDK